ncbi:MAG: efflux RND transporter periplasmic adaptor subunit [Burkholderiales bacterium]
MLRFLVLLSLFAPRLAFAALPFPIGNVEFRDVDQTYAVEGLVEAVKQATVSSQIAGRIIELKFDVGDYVRKGAVIARIDESVVGQQVAGSRAQVDQARALLDNARAQYERAKQLFAQKFISQAALDKSTAEYKAAQAQASASLAGAGEAAATRRFATIVAPFSGVVSARHIELGEMAQPGKPLLTGFDPKDLRVEVSVPEYKLPAVREQARAMVEIPSINKWVKATQVTVLPAADVKTHVSRVRLALPEDVRDVYPGMFARAHFAVGRAKKLLVPAAAVLRRSELTAVYVVGAQDQVQLRQVRLGEPVGEGQIEVLAGVMPGEKVALDPVRAGIYLKQGKN